jgi:hypothetical protein
MTFLASARAVKRLYVSELSSQVTGYSRDVVLGGIVIIHDGGHTQFDVPVPIQLSCVALLEKRSHYLWPN